jgi:peroxiredoxin
MPFASIKPLRCLAVALGLLALWLPATGYAAARLDVGSQAPALAGMDVMGTQRDLAAMRGKWVYLDFWATWCGPCMLDLPKVVTMSNELQARPDFAVLSVSLDEASSKQLVQWTVNEYGLKYPVLFDGQGWGSAYAEVWGITQIPATFLINPKGEIVARDLPAAAVAQFIGEPKAQPYRPMRISTSEEVLADSPSTGRENLRDVRISLALDPDLSIVRQFHLYLTCGSPQPQGQPSQHDMRYEITIKPSSDGQRSIVEMQRATGVSYLSDVFAQIRAIEPPAAASGDAPDISVEVNQASRVCVFVVPMPATCPQLTYALALFDERLGQYVNNGLVGVSLAGAQ